MAAWCSGARFFSVSYGLTFPPKWATNLVATAGTRNGTLALVGDGPPLVAKPALDRSILARRTAFFCASAVGAWPLAFQWQFNGTNLPAATNAWLAVSNAQPAQAGTYSLVVSNALGMVTNREGMLRVLTAQATILLSSLALTNGQFGFTGTGPAGLVWSVQSSSNLVTWQDLGTLTNSTGAMRFSDPATTPGQRFYRLKLVP